MSGLLPISSVAATDRPRGPGELYDYGATWQPDEAPLPLGVDDLLALEAALEEAGDTPRRIVEDGFAVEPEPQG